MATSLKRKARTSAEPDNHALKWSKHETPTGDTYAKPTLIVITEHLAHELRASRLLNDELKATTGTLERKLSASLARERTLAADRDRFKRQSKHDAAQANKWAQERHEARAERARSENIWEQHLNKGKADAAVAVAAAEEKLAAAEKKIAALAAENERLLAEKAAPTITIAAAEDQFAALTAENARLVAENETIRQEARDYADNQAGKAAAAERELGKEVLAEKEAEIAALKQKITEMVPRAMAVAFVHEQLAKAGVEKKEQDEDEDTANADDVEEEDGDDAAANGEGDVEEDDEKQGDAAAGHSAADLDTVGDSALGSSVASFQAPTSFFPQPEASVPDAAITTAPAPSATTTIAAAANPMGNLPFAYVEKPLFGHSGPPAGAFGVDDSGASGSYGVVSLPPPPPPPTAPPVSAAPPVSFPMGNAHSAQPRQILFGAAAPAAGGFVAEGFGASGPSGPIPQRPPPPPTSFFPAPAPAPVDAAPSGMDMEADYSSFNHSQVVGMDVDQPVASQAASFGAVGSSAFSSPFLDKYAMPGSRRAGKQRELDDDVEMEAAPAAPLSPRAWNRGLDAILAEPSKFSGRRARLSAAPASAPPAGVPTGPRPARAINWDPARRANRGAENSVRNSRGERESCPSPEAPIRHPRGGRGPQRKRIGAQQQQQPNRNSNPYRGTTDTYHPGPYNDHRDHGISKHNGARGKAPSHRLDTDNNDQPKRKPRLGGRLDPQAIAAANAYLAAIQASKPDNGVPGVFVVDVPITKKKEANIDSITNILNHTGIKKKPIFEEFSDDETDAQRARAMMGGKK